MIQLKHLYGGIYIIDNDPVLQDYILYDWKNSDIGFIFSPDLKNEIILFSNPTEKEYNDFFGYVKNHMSNKFKPIKEKINMYKDFKTEIWPAVSEHRLKMTESL